MMGNYGLPYKGSKNSIAEWVVEQLPSADNLYDLFGGGGAITDCACQSGKFKKVHYNELEPIICKLFKNSVEGKYKDENRWISREEFKRLKDADGYIASVWSFGNNCATYLYSKQVEPWKKAFWHVVMYNDYSLFICMGIFLPWLQARDYKERRLELRKIIKEHHEEYKRKYIEWYCKYVLLSDYDTEKLRLDLKRKIKKNTEELQGYLIDAKNKAGVSNKDISRVLGFVSMVNHYFGKSQWQFPTRENYNKLRESIMPNLKPYEEVYGLQELMESLQSLESLESLQSLQSLERLQSLGNITNASYEAVPILSNSVIYCDIPYRDTDPYITKTFDYERFYDWCCNQTCPVYVSEYNIPDDRFEVVAEKEKRVLLASNNKCKKVERVYRVKAEYKKFS